MGQEQMRDCGGRRWPHKRHAAGLRQAALASAADARRYVASIQKTTPT